MRFSLLFPLMLVAVGALTLLLGNAPAAGVGVAPPGSSTTVSGVEGSEPVKPRPDPLAGGVNVTTEGSVGEPIERPADPAPTAPVIESAPIQLDAADEPAETTGPPADQLPGVADEPPVAATETPASTSDLPAAAATPLFFMPVDGVSVAEVPSSFGDPRGSDRLHEGIDIVAERGTPVRAAAPGTVRRVTNSARGGLSVTIIGDDGLRYFYTHFDSFPPGLAVGQRVGLDTVIGYVGNSGNASATAPHLHFGVYRPVEGDPYSWQALDPLPFLIDRAPAGE